MGLNLLKRGLTKMKFDLNELNPGVFFSFDEYEGEDGGGVTIRLARQQDILLLAHYLQGSQRFCPMSI